MYWSARAPGRPDWISFGFHEGKGGGKKVRKDLRPVEDSFVSGTLLPLPVPVLSVTGTPGSSSEDSQSPNPRPHRLFRGRSEEGGQGGPHPGWEEGSHVDVSVIKTRRSVGETDHEVTAGRVGVRRRVPGSGARDCLSFGRSSNLGVEQKKSGTRLPPFTTGPLLLRSGPDRHIPGPSHSTQKSRRLPHVDSFPSYQPTPFGSTVPNPKRRVLLPLVTGPCVARSHTPRHLPVGSGGSPVGRVLSSHHPVSDVVRGTR